MEYSLFITRSQNHNGEIKIKTLLIKSFNDEGEFLKAKIQLQKYCESIGIFIKEETFDYSQEHKRYFCNIVVE